MGGEDVARVTDLATNSPVSAFLIKNFDGIWKD